MKWSFSNHRLFARCQRQWYYKNKLASARAKDPVRREAQRLSKLINVNAWRGRIVDSVISDTVIKAIGWGKKITLNDAIGVARSQFDEEKAAGLSNKYAHLKGFHGFLDIEYCRSIPGHTFEKAWNDIQESLTNLFTNDDLKAAIRAASYRFAQRSLMFKHDGVTIQAVPDLILLYEDRRPLIIDWKVMSNPQSDYWLQLATYAIALSRCNPHKDWPSGFSIQPSDVELMEVQLLRNEVRRHTVSEEDEHDLHDLVSSSGMRMAMACNGDGKAKDLLTTDFQTTQNPNNCQICSFRKMCWEVQ